MGIYPKEMKTNVCTKICTRTSTAAPLVRAPHWKPSPSGEERLPLRCQHTARRSDQWLGDSDGSQGGHAGRESQSQKAAQGSLHLCKDPNTTDGCAAKGEPKGLSGARTWLLWGPRWGVQEVLRELRLHRTAHKRARTRTHTHTHTRISSVAARKPVSWWGCVSGHLTQTPTLGGGARTHLQDASLQLPLDP